MSEGLSEGDIVLVDFEAWTEDDELFDTTRQDVADEAGWDVDDEEMDPMPVLLGGQRVVPGFEDALLDAEIGEEGSVEVPPTKAFGEHDADRVRVFSRREFEKKDIDPHPGTRVEINGRQGMVQQATASRVRVDFNHPFAGKTLRYEFKIIEKVEDDEERVRALVALDYGTDKADGFDITVEEETATLTVPEEASFDPQWFMARHRLAHDIFEHTELDQLDIVDKITREAMDEHDHGHGAPAATAPQSAATGAFEE